MNMRDGDAGSQMMETFATRQKEYKEELAKREDSWQKEFEKRVERKGSELKHREEALNVRQREMRAHYDNEMKNLDNAMNALMEEKQRMEKQRGTGKKSRK